jgi:hypothetical protein
MARYIYLRARYICGSVSQICWKEQVCDSWAGGRFLVGLSYRVRVHPYARVWCVRERAWLSFVILDRLPFARMARWTETVSKGGWHQSACRSLRVMRVQIHNRKCGKVTSSSNHSIAWHDSSCMHF